jgi:hypothetical protein
MGSPIFIFQSVLRVYVCAEYHGLSAVGEFSFTRFPDLLLSSLENNPVNASTMELRLEESDRMLQMLLLRSRGSTVM